MDCSNLSDDTLQSANASDVSSSKYEISQACALFDFFLYTVTVGLVCLLGVLGNALSFAVLTRDAHRSATSFLLRALAVADTLVLLTAVPLYVLPPIYPYSGYMADYYHLYLRILPLLWPVYLVPYTASILLTVSVSLDRYVAVCRPFKSARFFSPGRVRCLVLLVAGFSLLYNIPRFFEYEMAEVCVARNQSQPGYEISAFGDNRLYRILYANVAYFVLMHGGPLLCLAFLNSRLIQALRTRQRRKQRMITMAASAKTPRESRDITLVLIVVIFVFMFCQTPTLIDHVLWTAVADDQRRCGHWHYYYTAVGDALAILNSSINFVIYFLTSRKFRQSLVVCGAGRTSASGQWTASHVDGRRVTRAAPTDTSNSVRRQILRAGTCAALAPTSCTVTGDGRMVMAGFEH